MCWPKPDTLSSFPAFQRDGEAASDAASLAGGHRPGAPRSRLTRWFTPNPCEGEEWVRSRAPTRRVPSTPWSQMRACEHWCARRFRTRRRPTLPTVPAKGRRAAMNRSAFHHQDRLHLHGDRSPRVLRPASRRGTSKGPLGRTDAFVTFRKMAVLDGFGHRVGLDREGFWRPVADHFHSSIAASVVTSTNEDFRG